MYLHICLEFLSNELVIQMRVSLDGTYKGLETPVCARYLTGLCIGNEGALFKETTLEGSESHIVVRHTTA